MDQDQKDRLSAVALSARELGFIVSKCVPQGAQKEDIKLLIMGIIAGAKEAIDGETPLV